EALEQPLNGDTDLQPGQVRSDTTMRSCPKRQMTVVGAVDVHLVRTVKDLWIAVGGGKKQSDLLSFLDRPSRHLDIPGRRAKNQRNWRLQPDPSLNEGGDQRVVGSHPLLKTGLFGEDPHHHADDAR